MKTETQTRCTVKIDKAGTICKGALFTDLSISILEVSQGHRIYKCDKCGSRFKFTEEYKS